MFVPDMFKKEISEKDNAMLPNAKVKEALSKPKAEPVWINNNIYAGPVLDSVAYCMQITVYYGSNCNRKPAKLFLIFKCFLRNEP